LLLLHLDLSLDLSDLSLKLHLLLLDFILDILDLLDWLRLDLNLNW